MNGRRRSRRGANVCTSVALDFQPLVLGNHRAILTAVREIVQYRSLLRDLVARDLKVRYKRSIFGVA